MQCRGCVVTCKDWNNVAIGPAKWRKVISSEVGSYPLIKVFNLSISCNHCDEPACMAACPVGNIIKEEKYGLVLPLNKCISCKRCKAACPYDAPQFATMDQKELPMMEKCTGCIDRLEKGQKPACVDSCPQRALDFGPEEEIVAKYGNIRQIQGEFADPSLTKPNIVFTPKVYLGV
jgi:anaerobic dimethyl sulfoxide reductase subunit B (iron-sulfur subunit)